MQLIGKLCTIALILMISFIVGCDEGGQSDEEFCQEVEERLYECDEGIHDFSSLCTGGDLAECIREHADPEDECGDFLEGLTNCM